LQNTRDPERLNSVSSKKPFECVFEITKDANACFAHSFSKYPKPPRQSKLQVAAH
jgi:hypothetical protein